jgi:multiple sugar transport system permease protein
MATVAKSTPVQRTKPINYGRIISKTLAWLALLLLVSVTLFPILVMITTSLKSNQEAISNNTFFPSVWRFDNYPQMWNVVNFGNYLKNSLIICGMTMIVATLLATTASYALARFSFPGRDSYAIAVLGTQLIPGIMFLLPLFNTFKWVRDNLGIPLINTYLGMIVLYVAFFLPLSLWILRSFFAAIPPDLEEQALVDGCNRFQAFYKIALPLARPGIAATAIYVFLTAWDELLFAWVMTTTDDVQTVPVGIRLYLGQIAGGASRYELAMAAAVVVTIPLLILFFFVQKQMISGLTAGAVK